MPVPVPQLLSMFVINIVRFAAPALSFPSSAAVLVQQKRVEVRYANKKTK